MDRFSVNQLAKMAAVSVRTLHHYDRIGLLKPLLRSESKYRYYGKAELLRLQQILFYKEMDMPLAQIGDILDDPAFDTRKALQNHELELQKRKKRIDELIGTIHNTINQLNQQTDMNYEYMYKGFSKEQAEAYEKEARERWGDTAIDESIERVKKLSRAQWDGLQEERGAINKELSELMHLDIKDKAVQALVKRHYDLTAHYYDVDAEKYRGLANLYVTDERFKAHYEQYQPGLAAYISEAMLYFASQL